MGLRFLGLWFVRLWCGVVVCEAVVYRCVVDMCGVWCQVLCCVGLLHARGGGVRGGCITTLWWVVVHCGCKKTVHKGLGGIIDFWHDFLISSTLIV